MSDRVCTLQPYLAAGIFQHGPQRLSVAVGGNELLADLGRNGEIFYEGLSFNSPNTFSLYVKRKCNPSRKVDDGWASVKYGSQPLASYRDRLELPCERSPLLPERKKPNLGPPDVGQATPSPNSSVNPSPTTTPAPSPDPHMRHCKQAEVGVLPNGGPRTENHSIPPVDEARGRNAVAGGVGSSGPGGAMVNVAAGGERDEEPAIPEVVVPQWQPGDETWVQCDKCQQWRRVKTELVTDHMWFCYQNPDKRFASCEAPQELSDNAIDKLLEEEHFHTYVQSSLRGPVDECHPEAFEADLIAFLKQLGEDNKAEQIRNKRIQCNNRPLDVFGLYREVIHAGGLIANEAYDDTGRWVGRINFAGHVFPRMRNYTKDHRATSVGNQLLTNYRKFLYDYERAWRHIDLPNACKKTPAKPGKKNAKGGSRGKSSSAGKPAPQGQIGTSTPSVPNDQQRHSPVSDGSHRLGAAEATTPDRALNNTSAVRSASNGSEKRRDGSGASLSGSSSRRCDALLMLAGIMSDQDQGAGTAEPSRQLEPAGPCRPNRGPWQTKRRKTDHVFDPDALEAAITSSGDGSDSGWWVGKEGPLPGELLCARDPFKPGKLWPVIVASSQDLPEAISGGRSNDSARSTGFPFDMKDLSSCKGPALTVLVFGTNFMGWVPQALCEPFNRDSVNAAYSSVLRLPDESPGPEENSDSSTTSCCEQSILSRRILKAALQYENEAPEADRGRQMVKAMSLQYIGDRLLDLELDLPSHTLGNASFATWAEWRKRVNRAESALGLASECLMLGYQLDTSVLKIGEAAHLRPSLDSLLGTGRSCGEPTIRSVDKAVSLLAESIDWGKANDVAGKMDVEVQQEATNGNEACSGSASREPITGKKRPLPEEDFDIDKSTME
ncbi:hypothetical protein BSKO_13946 [Bryopsis sp. KO-2023]|nr:hypothetical protein BSKO_13946 [Bryopsis sp. KO-2023]